MYSFHEIRDFIQAELESFGMEHAKLTTLTAVRSNDIGEIKGAAAMVTGASTFADRLVENLKKKWEETDGD